MRAVQVKAPGWQKFYSLVSLPYVDKEPALGLSLYLRIISKRAGVILRIQGFE
jgi:hypothetical protein